MTGGFIAYSGASQIDGSPIVMIGTLKSANRKTGNAVQTWILRRNVDPLTAVKRGSDRAICGDCPLRHYLDGKCYVNVGQAPAGVWKAYKAGAYNWLGDQQLASALSGRVLRAGAYGDPAAVPIEAWARLRSCVDNTIGYTHQWAQRWARPYRLFCMASVDSVAEYHRATKQGWRTFRVKHPAEPILEGELYCPSDRVDCVRCGLCNGLSVKHPNPATQRARSRNICIDDHGSWLPYEHPNNPLRLAAERRKNEK